MAETPGTDLTPLVQSATALVAKGGSITLADLLKALNPAQVSEAPPARVPVARKISDSQRTAIAQMPLVYGKVVPTERRALEPGEVRDLLVERSTLKEVEKTAKARLEDINLIAHNHLDVVVEESTPEGERPLLDDKGHYIADGRFGVEDLSEEISRETREGAPSLSVAALEALEAEGAIDHKTFLALTRPVRVVDEAGVMAAVRKNPSLLAAIAKATTPGKKSTAINVRTKK